MFRFENSAAFYWLWWAVGLVFVYVYISARIDKKLKTAINERLLPYLTQSTSAARKKTKFILQVFVIVGFILALARPQMGMGSREIKSEGTQIIFMVDVSTSMLTQDLRSSRLEFAKKELIRLVDSLGGDKIGLVAFAGSAALLAPMTNDKSAIKMLLEGLDTQSVSGQGTAFEQGLNVSWEAFKRNQNDKEESVATRLVVIASDGEDNEPGALKAAEQMSGEGIKIFALGFGTAEGGPIPLPNGNKRDRGGAEVISKFVPDALRKLAETGGGSFYHVTFGNDAVAQMKNDIGKLQKSQFDSLMQTEYSERFQILLLIAIVLALIELALSERRQGNVIWRGRFGGTA
jgi:Ca-activated chloride channel homolog